MYRFWIIIVFLLFTINGHSQKKIASLPPALVESSALIKYKCSFLTLNDSGNKAKIFVFNNKGKIKHSCVINNATNIDWEALAYDGETFLYIGDIGNNENKRKDLVIYKVKMKDVLEKNSVEAVKISFSYPEQNRFPPNQPALYYDAEALIVKDNQLMIFTKNRTVPFDGISKVYTLPTKAGTYEAYLNDDLKLLPTNWKEESITDATYFEGELFILTYSKIYKLVWENGNWIQKKEYLHDSWTQKEGIAVDKKFIYLTDENESGIFTGNYLYKLKK
jgi:hypothetical protein